MKIWVNDTLRNVTALKAAGMGNIEVAVSENDYKFKTVASQVIPRDFLISEAMRDEIYITEDIAIRRYR